MAAPPAFRPKPAFPVTPAAVKPISTPPPVYRPNTAPGSQATNRPQSPPVFRPQSWPLQAKVNQATAHSGPAIYRPVPPMRGAPPRYNLRPTPVQAKFTPVAQARRNAIQRKITVTNNHAASEYAIMKVLHQLVQSPAVTTGGGNNQVSVLGAADLSTMGQGEILFIVGHGSRDTGDLGGITTPELLKMLNDNQKGVPAHIGEIRILTCFGGQVLQNSNLVERVAQGLKHKGIPVFGARGFTYGSPETISSGFNSVLSNDLIEFYEGNDEAKMLELAKNIKATENIENWELEYVPNWPATNQGTKLFMGEKISKVPEARLKVWIKEFVRLRGVHQKAFKDELATLPQGDINVKLNALAQSATYQGVVNQQYHQHKLLFTHPEEAYHTANS